MKKQLAAVLLLLSLGLAACDTADPADTDPVPSDVTDSAPADTGDENGAVFVLPVGDSILVPGGVRDIKALLGEPTDQQTAPSCVHDGDDILYIYEGLEIATSPSDKGQYTVSIMLTADNYKTMEGITIGDTAEDMKAAYGEAEESFGRYVYTMGKSTLTFMTDGDGNITSITYAYTGA